MGEQVPEQALAKFKELRVLATSVLPQAEESISYGIAARKLGGKGTLWFALDQSLPTELIKRDMLAHAAAEK